MTIYNHAQIAWYQKLRYQCLSHMMTLWLALLRLWLKILVKPQILNAEPEANLMEATLPDKVTPSLGIGYVLRSRSWAEALILEKCCHVHNDNPLNITAAISTTDQPYVLYLDRRGFHQLTTAPKTSNTHDASDRMLSLGTEPHIRDHLCDPKQPHTLIPVSFFWGRAPDRSHSLWKLLFSESWKKPNALKKALRIIWHGRECSISFGAPISLPTSHDTKPLATATLTPETQDHQRYTDSRQCRKLFRLCRMHFRQERIAAIGPDLSHRRQITHSVVSSPQVRLAIEQAITQQQSASKKKPQHAHLLQAQKKKAHHYAMEIASDYAHGMVRAYHLLLSRLWHKLYDGVAVHGVSRVQAIAGTHTLIYVPCHRSHIDYLLLPFILYNAGLAPPHTAAGINLNLPLIGRLLRHGGAFFLRRQFKGNALYTAVFQSYLAVMLTQGFSLAFFIEGGRSRSGRLLPPKLGMVNMILKNYFDVLAPQGAKPIAFVPVYIGYEKLFEGNTYIKELNGLKKKPESLSGLLGSLRRLRYHFGQVHIQFAAPICLPEALPPESTADPAAEASTTSPTEKNPFRTQVQTLGASINRSINTAAVVADINLVSLVMLAAPRHALDENILQAQLTLYQALLASSPQNTQWIVSQNSPEEMIASAEKLGLIQRQTLFLGDLLLAHPSKALLLTYFKNNCLHTLCLPALMACVLLENNNVSALELNNFVRALIPMLQEELNFTYSEEELTKTINDNLSLFSKHGLLVNAESDTLTMHATLATPPTDSAAALKLTLLCQIIRPSLERYLVTLTFIRRQKEAITDTAALIDLLQQNLQRLAVLAEFNAPEFFDLKLVETLVSGAENHNWIQWAEMTSPPNPEYAHTKNPHERSVRPTPDGKPPLKSVHLSTHGEAVYHQLRKVAGDNLIPLLNL